MSCLWISLKVLATVSSMFQPEEVVRKQLRIAFEPRKKSYSLYGTYDMVVDE